MAVVNVSPERHGAACRRVAQPGGFADARASLAKEAPSAAL